MNRKLPLLSLYNFPRPRTRATYTDFPRAISWLAQSMLLINLNCSKYNDTVNCMDDPLERCAKHDSFHLFTSGLHYMCIEQYNG